MSKTSMGIVRILAIAILFTSIMALLIEGVFSGRVWFSVALGTLSLGSALLIIFNKRHPGPSPIETPELLQSILETGESSCYAFDRQGRFVMARTGLPDLAHFPIPPRIGQGCAELWGKEFAIPFEACLNQVFVDGKPRTLRYPLTGDDGRKRFFEARVRLFESKPGQDSWAIMVISNISAQVRFEKMQASNIRWFRSLFNRLSEALVLSDGHNIIRGVNQRAVELYGYSKDQLLDQPFDRLFADGHAKVSIELVRNQENPVRVTESRHLRRDGSSFPVEIRSSLIRIENQDFHLALLRDISFQKELEEQQRIYEKNLIDQNAMRDKLFSIIAHDLRGPVGTLRSFLGSYKQDHNFFSPQELEEFLLHMGQAIGSTWDLLENLLAWVRNQFENISINHNPVSLVETCRTVAGWLAPQAAAKGQNLVIDSHIDHVILTDANMLQTVIRNLVGNAIKFSPAQGTIRLRVMASEQEAGIAVEDCGSGIPAQKILELFLLRGGSSTVGTAGEKGSGLGLVLCQEIINRLGGHIAVDSSPQGSIFSVWLPARVEGELDTAEDMASNC